jgi:hypothetical protein
MNTPTREQIVTSCVKFGLLKYTDSAYRVENASGDKYAAVCELSLLYTESPDPKQSARTAIWQTLNRVTQGLDPLKENRGGARAGSGRKFVTPKS